MTDAVLEIDVGNSFLKWRRVAADGRVIERGRLSSREPLQLSFLPTHAAALDVRIASVAGDELNHELERQLRAHGVQRLRFAATAARAAGVTNSYPDPTKMGVDRWLAMLAAWQRCGSACCVVDCGSAITLDFLDAQGVHLGGYILPGMRLLREALLGNTARVFAQAVGEFNPMPGRDTSAAVLNGADFLFDAIQLRLRQQLTPATRVFVTGGDGELFWQRLQQGEWVPDLVLDGLVLALEG